LVVLCILSNETSIYILGTSVVARVFAPINPIIHLTGFSFNLSIRKELFLPLGTDAETEARVCGTSFFKMIDGRFLFLRRDPTKDLWEVQQAKISPTERP